MSSSEAKNSSTTSRILVWPSSLLEPGSPSVGLVIGWKSLHGHETWPSREMIVVAGVLDLQEGGRDHLEQSIERSTRLRLQKLKANCCYCCVCAEVSPLPRDRLHSRQGCQYKEGRSCDGCVRKFCWEDIELIAFYCKNGADASLRSTFGHLRWISVTSEGYPWWNDDTTPEIIDDHARQLVLYEDIDHHGSPCLYRGSMFSESFLVRLCHSSHVISTLLETDCESAPEMSSTPLPPQDTISSDIAMPPGSDTLTSMLLRYSILFRRLSAADTFGCATYSHPFAFVVLRLSLHRANALPSHPADHLCKVCQRCRTLPESHFTTAEREISQADVALRATADCFFGLVIGIVLVVAFSRVGGADGAQSLINSFFALIKRGIEWLGRFPIGFKLNERLTERMGEVLLAVLTLNETMLTGVVRWVVSWRLWSLNTLLLPAVSCAIGASGVVAVLVDVSHLCAVQLFSLSYCYRKLYRLELYLLSALWLLLRGKKKNVLRNRSDTMEYDSTQLLLGTILFTIITALLTTVLVYHLFFAVSSFAADALLLPLYLLHLALLQFPVGQLAINRRSNFFVEGLILQTVKDDPMSTVDVTSLVAVKTSSMSMMKGFVCPALATVVSRISSGVIGWFTGAPSPGSPFPIGPLIK